MSWLVCSALVSASLRPSPCAHRAHRPAERVPVANDAGSRGNSSRGCSGCCSLERSRETLKLLNSRTLRLSNSQALELSNSRTLSLELSRTLSLELSPLSSSAFPRSLDVCVQVCNLLIGLAVYCVAKAKASVETQLLSLSCLSILSRHCGASKRFVEPCWMPSPPLAGSNRNR
jgi:hypothetical protein